MDIERPDLARKHRRRRITVAAGAVAAIVGLSIVAMQVKPGIPTVDRAGVWIGTVERGDMLREVRGIGALVPEEVRWISARGAGRVERILVLPGTWVEPDTVIMELSNPTLQQEAVNAGLQLKAAEADLVSRRVQLEAELLQARADLAQLEAQYQEAKLEAETNEQLFTEGLEPELTVKRSRLRAEQLAVRWELEKQRLDFRNKSLEPQLASQQANVDQMRSRQELLQSQVDGLRVRAGFAGVLQSQTVEQGMQINPGQSLAQVANPRMLKAVIRIPEIQAKDVEIGLGADIDTRNGIVRGLVVRVDPNVIDGTVAVDVKLEGELPKGARPDLTVEGRIELEQLTDITYVGRPVFARPDAETGIFRLDPATKSAHRVSVRFGRASVSLIEVAAGLEPGDEVILSDMSQWEEYEAVRIQ